MFLRLGASRTVMMWEKQKVLSTPFFFFSSLVITSSLTEKNQSIWGRILFRDITFNYISTLMSAENKVTFRIWTFLIDVIYYKKVNRCKINRSSSQVLTVGNCPHEKHHFIYWIIRLQNTASNHNTALIVSVLVVEDYNAFEMENKNHWKYNHWKYNNEQQAF